MVRNTTLILSRILRNVPPYDKFFFLYFLVGVLMPDGVEEGSVWDMMQEGGR